MHEFIDLLSQPSPRPSRWDHGAGEGAIRALDNGLRKAGLPGRLAPAQRLLDRAEELAEAARQAKAAATSRMEGATWALLADGPIDLDACAVTVTGAAVWLDERSPAMLGAMGAAGRTQANATQVVFGMAPGIYAELQQACEQVVGEVAAVAQLPNPVWTAATSGLASTVAIRGGHEQAWTQLVKLGARWDDIHAAAALLRETGVFQAQLLFPAGCPGDLGTQFLGWEAAVEQLPRIRRLPAPLRVRAAHDAGLRPGLYLASDHVADRERAAAKARPGLLARLGVGSGPKPERVEVR